MPVYYPEATSILGLPVYRRLVDVPGDMDMVDVFRRPQDVPGHLEDIVAKRPKAVWLQLGIRNEEVAEKLVAEGIDVVQDRCILVEHRRWMASRGDLDLDPDLDPRPRPRPLRRELPREPDLLRIRQARRPGCPS